MKSKTKIKFCGLTKEQDVQAAINLNINLVGFIYVKNTPRYINFKNSKKIIDKFKNQVSFVGVFLDNSNEFIEQGIKVGINFIQLHGSESPSRCREIKKEFKLPIIKSIPIFEEKDLFIIKEYSDDIDMFLFSIDNVYKPQVDEIKQDINERAQSLLLNRALFNQLWSTFTKECELFIRYNN